MWINLEKAIHTQYPEIPKCIGIDFGTTFCAIAMNGNLIGDLIPSVILYVDGKPHVGNRAIDMAMTYGLPLVRSIKSLLKPETAYEPYGPYGKTPYTMAVDVFCSIGDYLLDWHGERITPCVVTVPAYFTEPQRSIIRRAALDAGFNVLRLISEPTAASLAYDQKGLYGVYDLGGGTFDFSVMTLKEGLFRVLATGGHTSLGGDQMDEVLAKAYFPEKLPEDALRAARTLKESGARDKDIDALLKPLIDTTLSICDATIEDAGVTMDALAGILLVGGSTRHPYVQERLREQFGDRLNSQLHPDRAVAIGASIYANNLTGTASFLLLDVSPLSLGIETLGGLVERILPRNTPLPARMEKQFTTAVDGQSSIILHVVQGEQELVQNSHSLGKIELGNIPFMPKGMPRLRVVFSLDQDGLLCMEAEESHTGQKVTLSLNTVAHLSNKLIEIAKDQEGDDLPERLWIDKTSQAVQAILEVERILSQDEIVENNALKSAILALKVACDIQDWSAFHMAWSNFEILAVPVMEAHLEKRLKTYLDGDL